MTIVAPQSVNEAVTAYGKELLIHAEKHYTDYQIANDMDCILVECPSDGDRKLLRRYARLRRQATDFRPKANRPHSNHDRIRVLDLDQLHSWTGLEVESDGIVTAMCSECEHSFTTRRKDAVTCSASCRKARARRLALGGAVGGANVTLK
jgi:hypothetical protein